MDFRSPPHTASALMPPKEDPIPWYLLDPEYIAAEERLRKIQFTLAMIMYENGYRWKRWPFTCSTLGTVDKGIQHSDPNEYRASKKPSLPAPVANRIPIPGASVVAALTGH